LSGALHEQKQKIEAEKQRIMNMNIMESIGMEVEQQSENNEEMFDYDGEMDALEHLIAIAEACLKFEPSDRPSADELVKRFVFEVAEGDSVRVDVNKAKSAEDGSCKLQVGSSQAGEVVEVVEKYGNLLHYRVKVQEHIFKVSPSEIQRVESSKNFLGDLKKRVAGVWHGAKSMLKRRVKRCKAVSQSVQTAYYAFEIFKQKNKLESQMDNLKDADLQKSLQVQIDQHIEALQEAVDKFGNADAIKYNQLLTKESRRNIFRFKKKPQKSFGRGRRQAVIDSESSGAYSPAYSPPSKIKKAKAQMLQALKKVTKVVQKDEVEVGNDVETSTEIPATTNPMCPYQGQLPSTLRSAPRRENNFRFN